MRLPTAVAGMTGPLQKPECFWNRSCSTFPREVAQALGDEVYTRLSCLYSSKILLEFMR